MRLHIDDRATLLACILLVLTGLVLTPQGDASAQYAGQNLWGLTWDLLIPFGDTQDFAPGASGRSIGVTWRKFVKPDVSVGLEGRWNVFYEKTRGTIELDGGAVTGTQFRDINAVPLLANVHYYMGDRNALRPYMGLGLGTMYVKRQLDIGLFRNEVDEWQFAASPEVGLLLPEGSFLGFLAARYTLSSSTTDIVGQSYLSISLSFSWLD